MSHTIHDISVSHQIGRYSDAIEVEPHMRWLFTSGTPGLHVDGTLPADIVGQTELAWRHILQMLEKANMSVVDLVKVTQYLTRAEDIPSYAATRTRYLGDVEPASMLLVVPQLVRPEFLIELEIVAAKALH